MKPAGQIIEHILLTEKGTQLSASENQYLFKVSREANKIEIRHAVEELFKVRVASVNTMNRKGKKKRERSWNFGRTPGWKRAVVTLHPEDSIDLT